MVNYEKKYVKYKSKYLQLKGGANNAQQRRLFALPPPDHIYNEHQRAMYASMMEQFPPHIDRYGNAIVDPEAIAADEAERRREETRSPPAEAQPSPSLMGPAHALDDDRRHDMFRPQRIQNRVFDTMLEQYADTSVFPDPHNPEHSAWIARDTTTQESMYLIVRINYNTVIPGIHPETPVITNININIYPLPPEFEMLIEDFIRHSNAAGPVPGKHGAYIHCPAADNLHRHFQERGRLHTVHDIPNLYFITLP